MKTTKQELKGNLRKVFAALLALTLVVSLFAACKPNKEESPEVTGPAEPVDASNKGWNPVITNGELTEPPVTQPTQQTLSQEQLQQIAMAAVNARRQSQSIPGGQTVALWDGKDLSALTDEERALVEDKVKQDTGVDVSIQKDGSVHYPPAATQPSQTQAGTTKVNASYTTGGGQTQNNAKTTAAQNNGGSGDKVNPGVAETIGGGNLSLADPTQAPAKPDPVPAGTQRTKLSTFGSADGHTRFRAVAPTANGGYVVAALVDSGASNVPSGYTGWATAIIQYSPEGKAEWTKYFGGNADFQLTAITVLKDGSIIAAGNTAATNLECPTHNGADTDAVFLKLKGNGEKVWMKSFQGSLGDAFESVAATPDGGFMIGGYAVSSDGDFEGLPGKLTQTGTGGTYEVDTYKAIAIKMDKDGNVFRKRVMYGTVFSSFAALAVDASNGDVYAAIRTSATDYDFSMMRDYAMENGLVIRFSKDLEAHWLKPFASNGKEAITGLAPVSGGGVVAVGSIALQSYGMGSFASITSAGFGRLGVRDAVALRYNRDGSVAWIRSLGDVTDDEATSVAAVEGGFVVTGIVRPLAEQQVFVHDWMNSTHGGDNDGCVWLLRENGTPVKSFLVGGSGMDAIYGAAAKGRNFAFVGSSPSSDGFMEGASLVSASNGSGHMGMLAVYQVQYTG